MGRLRLRVIDVRGQERIRGSIEDVARLEVELEEAGASSVIKLRQSDGALVSEMALSTNGDVDVRSGRWENWPAASSSVENLTVSVRTMGALAEHVCAELRQVEEVQIRVPAAASDPWELTVNTGPEGDRGCSVQSTFSIFPPWTAAGQRG